MRRADFNDLAIRARAAVDAVYEAEHELVAEILIAPEDETRNPSARVYAQAGYEKEAISMEPGYVTNPFAQNLKIVVRLEHIHNDFSGRSWREVSLATAPEREIEAYMRVLAAVRVWQRNDGDFPTAGFLAP